MEKEQQIYVRFGDYVVFSVESLQGSVTSQGFTNKSVFLQINSNKFAELLARNKPDFVWRIMPKTSFDARCDYDEALDFYEHNFGSKMGMNDEEGEGEGDQGEIIREVDADMSRASQTSFFGQGSNLNQRGLTASQKQEKEQWKMKLMQYQRKLTEEENQAGRYSLGKLGEIVEYGNEVQLMHVTSGKYLQGLKTCAVEDNSCNVVELAEQGNQHVYWKVLGGFRYKQEGDKVHYNDQIVLQNVKVQMYLHVTEKLLVVEGLEGQAPPAIEGGRDEITPTQQDRRSPANQYAPICEVNVSNQKTKFQIQIYRYFNEDREDNYIKGGSVVRLLHSEKGGYLHSDDCDFTDDGITEVYLWSFKGKATDMDSISSNSLFLVELASPQTPAGDDEVGRAGGEQDSHVDINDRVGKVFSYSDTGGLGRDTEQKDDVHYRFRHINTGRLVIDQEIEQERGSIRTLGLSPHLVPKNLKALSDHFCDGCAEELDRLNDTSNFDIDRGHQSAYAPRTYDEIDVRSRFRVISTSPSLDPRIKTNSCVQIQHVESGFYLSYAQHGALEPGVSSDKGQNDAGATDKAGAAHAGHGNQTTTRVLFDAEGNQNGHHGHKDDQTHHDQALYVAVDREDIISGARDAIELKPIMSNEDAFFMIPETEEVLQSIMFVQTSVDLLKRYLPVICSTTLQSSREKQGKIFELLAAIQSFLIGDTAPGTLEADNYNLAKGFSKDDNDKEKRSRFYFTLRQKLMRELCTVESLVHILYLPFKYGDYALKDVGRDAVPEKIVAVCQKAYYLIKLISQQNYQNELYVSQWINLYFHHSMSTDSHNDIGAEEAIISLVDNNIKLLERQIDHSIIKKFVELCIAQQRQRRLIQLLCAVCSCNGKPVYKNQTDVVKYLLHDDDSRNYLMMPVRMHNDSQIDVLMMSNDRDSDSQWTPLSEARGFRRSVYGYFLSIIDLSAELCLGRHKEALDSLQEMYSFDTARNIVKDPNLPHDMRSLFVRVLLHMHMDREPLEPLQIPQQTSVWDEVPAFFKEQYADRDNLLFPIQASKIDVPGSLFVIRKFVETYLDETGGIQSVFEVGKNMMTFQILKVIRFMVTHGFYKNLRELREVAAPMVNLLNGSNDVYFTAEEAEQDAFIDDFVSGKRYFSSGTNDIIVQCKAIICENLLTISMLEIDGKTQVFLQKFKADLDLLSLQESVAQAREQNEDPAKPSDAEAKAATEKKSGGGWFSFGGGGGSNKVEPETSSAMTMQQVEHESVEFLTDLARSFNFEAENQDAYICVLFDLLLYKYPQLAKGVFELLVRLFARKRTLLENLLQVKMLENPRSIKTLKKVQKMHQELKRYVSDAEQWLNKVNRQARQAKYEVTKIFMYFAEICREEPEQKPADLDLTEDAGAKADPAEAPGPAKPISKLLTPEEYQEPVQARRPSMAPSAAQTGVQKACAGHKVNRADFLLFERSPTPANKENQRLLNSFQIETLAVFFIKYRVDRNSVNDPFYQQLIHMCYTFLVAYVKDNLQNQIKVHDNIETFLRDIDRNPAICLLIYELFRDNKKFLTLNVAKILRQIIVSAEEASLQSSKKALYLKLLEVFCKFEDKLVRPNQQEIVVNFTRDISKNNLIYLFSNEGLPHLCKLVQDCLPPQLRTAGPDGEANIDGGAVAASSRLNMEIFNVIVCLQLMSICCEGKSDVAEQKCQEKIMDVAVALQLYRGGASLWPFKTALLTYVAHVYMDSGNPELFAAGGGGGSSQNMECLRELLKLVQVDMAAIYAGWHEEESYQSKPVTLINPDQTETTFREESHRFAMTVVTRFFKACLKNKRVEFKVELWPNMHELAACMAKMYYKSSNEEYKSSVMDCLIFINNSEKHSRLLDNVTHPANQNIYAESAKIAGERSGGQPKRSQAATQSRSGQLQQKLIQFANSPDMIEQREREFELLVLWVTNIDERIQTIMKYNAVNSPAKELFNPRSFANVTQQSVVSAFMVLLDSRCLEKELHITGLTLLRKLVEVENKELVTPAADWESDDWVANYRQVIAKRQTDLVEIGCVEFLCKHIQDTDDADILEQTFLVCITLLIGGNERSQDAFYNYFYHKDHMTNTIMLKLKDMLFEHFDLTKKFVADKSAKLGMIYKIKQRQDAKRKMEEERQAAIERAGQEQAPEQEAQESDDEQLLTMDESMQQNDEDPEQEEGAGGEERADPAQPAASKSEAMLKCIRHLRFLQLLTESHHTNLQNFLREQTHPNGMQNQKSFDFICYVAQMLAVYEKQFVNCYSCPLGLQLMDTLVEVVQGPCKANQRRLVDAKIIDCCRDLIQQGQQSKHELLMRGFTTAGKTSIHDELKMSAIKLLLSIIEGSIELPVYRQIADSMDDFSILTKRLEQIYARFVTEELGLTPGIPVTTVNLHLRKESFQGAVREGFDIFCLINQLSRNLDGVRGKLQDFFKSDGAQFFRINTGNIEMIKNDDLVEIFFPIQPVCRKMKPTSKDRFAATVNIQSHQHKLMGLIASVPQFNDEMEHLERCSHDVIAISPDRLDFLRDFSTGIAVAISFIVIGFYRYDRIERADGSSDFRPTISEGPRILIEYLGYGQLMTALMLLFGFAYNNNTIIVKQGWRDFTKLNRKVMIDDVTHILNNYQPEFGDFKAESLPINALRVLLLTEGPYHAAWGAEGRRDYRFLAVLLEYHWISLSFLMANFDFVFSLAYLAFSVQGSFQSPVFYSFQLLDVINRFPDLASVVRSVTENGNQLMMTAMLGAILLYIYAAFAFIFVADTYYDDNIHSGLLNRKGDSTCQSMAHCFLSTINYGLRGGGGIGEFLPTQTAAEANMEGFYFRAAFDLSFFLLIITILLNIIFGIIIDTFGQLREEETARLDDQKFTCFMCDLDAAPFDREEEDGFNIHKRDDHHVWYYLFFLTHLRQLEPSELDGNQSYVLHAFAEGDIQWFPAGRSLRLERAADKAKQKRLAESGGEEIDQAKMLETIEQELERIDDKVREIIKKY